MATGGTQAKIVLSAEDRTRAAFASVGKSLADTKGHVAGIQGQLVALASALALPAAFALFDRLNKEAGNFQDLAEKTGDSAEAIASLNLAAGTAGTGMDAVAAASIRLTKNLTGVDDESQAAGAAIAALGLNLEDFKKLKPADQMEAVAKALNSFAEGAGKTAVAVDLFGKAGADMLPFLKELGAEGGRQVILSEEQIRLADEYSDKQARLRTSIALHAQAIATQMLPAYNALSEAFLDVIKDIDGVKEGAVGLKNSTAIQDWAKDAVEWIAKVVDAGQGAARVIEIVGKANGAAYAAVAAAGKGEFSQAKTIMSEFARDADEIMNREFFSDKLKRRLAESSGVIAPKPGDARPGLKYSGAKKNDGKDAAAQEAKAQLAADIEAIKKGNEQLAGSYANAEKIMEAVRAAGMIDEREYYQAKRGFLQLAGKAREDELAAEIARYRQEQLTGKDKIDNDKKIASAEADLATLRAKNTADLQVLSIQQEAAVKRVAKSYEEARMAAEDYLATTGKSYQRELAAFGRGDRARDKAAAFNQIGDKYGEQRTQLENQKRLMEFEGTFTADARKQYETRLAIITEFQGKAQGQWEQYYARLLQEQSRWDNGANRAIENYMDGAANTAEQMERLFTSAFGGMEDALVEFVKSGKLDFKSLADSIVADITRIVVRQQIMAPMAKWLQNDMSGSSGGGIFGGLFNNLFGSGGGGFGTGGTFGNQDFGGFFAAGGTLKPGQWGIAGEHGPERIFAGATPVQVLPHQGAPMQQTINFINNGPVDRRTQDQVAKAAYMGSMRAAVRNG